MPLDAGLAGARGRGACAPTARRRWRWGCCSRSPTRSTSAAVADGAARGPARRPRERVERGAARDPRVRAPLDDGGGRLPHARAAHATWAAWPSARPRPGCRRPAIMQSSGGVLPIEASAEHAAWTVLSGPAGGVIGAARLAAREGTPAGADLRHGRHLVRRRAGPRRGPGPHQRDRHRRPPAAPADARRRDGLGRRRQHRLGRLRRGAARRPPLGGRPPRPRRLRPGRRPSPTVTDANVVLGRLPADAPLGGAHRASTPTPPRPRSGGLAERARHGAGGLRRGHPRRWRCRRWSGRCGW